MNIAAARAGVAIIAFGLVLLFYATVYSVHQDLAGTVLTGKLAATLRDRFTDYVFYVPPFELFWASLAVHLSDATGSPPGLVVIALTTIAAIFSAELGFRIRRILAGESLLFFLAPLLVLLVVPILVKNVYGLREHMVAIGLWPYLVLRISWHENARVSLALRVVLGLWMGLNLLFKVFYSLVVFLVEAVDAVFQRRPLLLFRVENVIAGAIVTAYLLTWLGLDWEQREALTTMKSAISASLMPPAAAILHVCKWAFFGMLILVIGRQLHADTRQQFLAFAVVLSTVAVAWLQERWFNHHLLPVVLAFIAWWWLIGGVLPKWGHCVLGACIAFYIYLHFEETRLPQIRVPIFEKAISDAGISLEGKRVGMISLHASPYNQLIASEGGTRWATLANIAHVSAELEPFDRPENAGMAPPPLKFADPGWMLLHDRMMALWEDFPPDVLIIDRTHRWPLQYIQFDWHHLLSEDQRFNAVMEGFVPAISHHDPYLSFDLYLRAD